MSDKFNIGILGRGFVGSAVENGFTSTDTFKSEIRVFDINPEKSLNTLEDTINHSDYTFVSVPTPAKQDGSIDLSILDLALKSISDVYDNEDNIILIRSTVTPGTTEYFEGKYKKLRLVFNPEFLTERNAKNDFLNQDRIILGGANNNVERVEHLYLSRFGKKPIIKTNFATAELIKYMNNCFLATKVSFMNEMKMVADKSNVDWNKAVEGFALDSRVGQSHLQVPGIDGKLGFGGSCFPKDIQALISYGKSKNLDLNVLLGAWETNLKVRSERDWEELKGRAVNSE